MGKTLNEMSVAELYDALRQEGNKRFSEKMERDPYIAGV